MKRLKKWMDPRLAQISLYVIGTFLVIYLLYKALGSTGTVLTAFGKGLHWLLVILKPLITGFAAAYILYPVADFFEKKFLKRSYFQNRPKTAHSLGVAVTWLLIAAVVFLLLSLGSGLSVVPVRGRRNHFLCQSAAYERAAERSGCVCLRQ